MFTIRTPEFNCTVIVYVDDIIIVAQQPTHIQTFKNKLTSAFNCKELGIPSWLLGVRVLVENDSISLVQDAYVDELLEEFNLDDAHPAPTPATGPRPTENKGERFDCKYRELIGKLQYVSNFTRPDISTSLNQLASYMANPSEDHWTAVCRIARYLKDKKNYGLRYKKGTQPPLLTAYTDADYAGCTDTRRSTTGYIICIDGTPIAWRSTRQKNISTSTAESEYCAASDTAKQVQWTRQFLHELGFPQQTPTIFYCDNQSAISVINNTGTPKGLKHVDIRMHHIRELAHNNIINTTYIPTNDNVADIMTKTLPGPAHRHHTDNILTKLHIPNTSEHNEPQTTTPDILLLITTIPSTPTTILPIPQ